MAAHSRMLNMIYGERRALKPMNVARNEIDMFTEEVKKMGEAE